MELKDVMFWLLLLCVVFLLGLRIVRILDNGRPVSWRSLKKERKYLVLRVVDGISVKYAFVEEDAYHYTRPFFIFLPPEDHYLKPLDYIWLTEDGLEVERSQDTHTQKNA